MFRGIHVYALSLCYAVLVAPLSAQHTPPPPEWMDRTSVYLEKKQETFASTASGNATSEARVHAPSVSTVPDYKTTATTVASIQKAQHPPATDHPSVDQRRLAPPTGRRSGYAHARENPSERDGARTLRLVNFGLPLDTIYAILTALAIVVGVFLLFVWLLRRGGAKTASVLPADVVSVLGRVPLASRQFAELLRVGNKLVLVSLTPTSAETLTEVTDPVEVDRLLGLCQQCSPHSTTKAFEQVFQQLSRDTSRSGSLSSERPQTNLPLMDAFRSRPSGHGRG